MKKMNKKGFTLAELLIVVAIIAVLVAIAIPIFSAQLEKSREATDLANIRSLYAEVVAAAIVSDEAQDISATVKLKQQQSGWQTNDGNIQFAGSGLVQGLDEHVDVQIITNNPDQGTSAEVKYVAPNGTNAATVEIRIG